MENTSSAILPHPVMGALGAAAPPASGIVPDALYRETEAADLIGISVSTLQKWRLGLGSNPKLSYRKIGRNVRYCGRDILDLIEKSLCSSTSQGAR